MLYKKLATDLNNAAVTSPEARRDVILNITPTALYKISEKNPDVARGLAAIKRAGNGLTDGDMYEGEVLDAAEAQMLDRHITSLNSRNDRGI